MVVLGMHKSGTSLIAASLQPQHRLGDPSAQPNRHAAIRDSTDALTVHLEEYGGTT